MFEWSEQETGVISRNSVLEFQMIVGSDGAVYECTVSNAAGNETRNVTLTGVYLCKQIILISIVIICFRCLSVYLSVCLSVRLLSIYLVLVYLSDHLSEIIFVSLFTLCMHN